MANYTIDALWSTLRELQGVTFHTKTGKPFTYSIQGDVFIPSRTDYQISKSDFSKALKLAPFDGPGEINNKVRGPSYIWAILHDPKVCGNRW